MQAAQPKALSDAYFLIRSERPELSETLLQKDAKTVRDALPDLRGTLSRYGYEIDGAPLAASASQFWIQLRTRYPFVSNDSPISKKLLLDYAQDEGVVIVGAQELRQRLPEDAAALVEGDKETILGSLPGFKKAVQSTGWKLTQAESGAAVSLMWQDLRLNDTYVQPETPLTSEEFSQYVLKNGTIILGAYQIKKLNPAIPESVLEHDKRTMASVLDSLKSGDGSPFAYDKTALDESDLNAAAATVWFDLRTQRDPTTAADTHAPLSTARVDAYASEHGVLVIESEPNGSRVWVGQKQLSHRTQCTVAVTPGEYQVKFGTGYEPAVVPVKVAARQIVPVKARLKRTSSP